MVTKTCGMYNLSNKVFNLMLLLILGSGIIYVLYSTGYLIHAFVIIVVTCIIIERLFSSVESRLLFTNCKLQFMRNNK